jgi:hypothetical protein
MWFSCNLLTKSNIVDQNYMVCTFICIRIHSEINMQLQLNFTKFWDGVSFFTPLYFHWIVANSLFQSSMTFLWTIFFMKHFHFEFNPPIPLSTCIIKLSCILLYVYIHHIQHLEQSPIILFCVYISSPIYLKSPKSSKYYLLAWNIGTNLYKHLNVVGHSHCGKSQGSWCVCILTIHGGLKWLCFSMHRFSSPFKLCQMCFVLLRLIDFDKGIESMNVTIPTTMYPR